MLIALASAQGSLISGSFPILFLCFAITFSIQWIVFVPSYFFTTERFYDLTGSLTFITIALTSFYYKNQFLVGKIDLRSSVITIFILIWAFPCIYLRFLSGHRAILTTNERPQMRGHNEATWGRKRARW